MKKYIPYLLKFAFMIFAIFPAIKHEWLAISTGSHILGYKNASIFIAWWKYLRLFMKDTCIDHWSLSVFKISVDMLIAKVSAMHYGKPHYWAVFSSSISTFFTFLNRSEAKTRSLSFSLVELIISSLLPCHSFCPL